MVYLPRVIGGRWGGGEVGRWGGREEVFWGDGVPPDGRFRKFSSFLLERLSALTPRTRPHEVRLARSDSGMPVAKLSFRRSDEGVRGEDGGERAGEAGP